MNFLLTSQRSQKDCKSPFVQNKRGVSCFIVLSFAYVSFQCVYLFYFLFTPFFYYSLLGFISFYFEQKGHINIYLYVVYLYAYKVQRPRTGCDVYMHLYNKNERPKSIFNIGKYEALCKCVHTCPRGSTSGVRVF